MAGKILSIQEKVPQKATLPDGTYTGKWGGTKIELRHGGKTYELTTDEGVRGMGFSVVVNIVDGVATFTKTMN